MTAVERRTNILALLGQSDKPVSASTLAAQFQVSRQIIVGDIALLRAQGTIVIATPRGYCLAQTEDSTLIRTIACKHDGSLAEMELNICIDYGCKVLDVIVEHPLYGQLTGELQLATRYDVRQFIQKMESDQIHALCELTNDVHLHTLKCPDEETYERVCRELDEAGILMKK